MKNVLTLSFDREEMNATAKQLFLYDLQAVIGDYFECEKQPVLDVTRTKDGFAVCILFDARRIKSAKNIP